MQKDGERIEKESKRKEERRKEQHDGGERKEAKVGLGEERGREVLRKKGESCGTEKEIV